MINLMNKINSNKRIIIIIIIIIIINNIKLKNEKNIKNE